MLARREYSTAQIRDALRRRGFPEPDIENAIAQLAADGMLDDRRAATAFARRARERLHAPRRVLAQLEQQYGIHHAIGRAAVDEVYAGVAERDLVEAALERRHVGNIRTAGELRRLAVALVRQGHDRNVIEAVLTKRFDQPGERERGPGGMQE